jgi:hypothetical protein
VSGGKHYIMQGKHPVMVEIVILDPSEYDFIMGFDPDRDRVASRADMVDVLFTIQRIIAEARI